MIQRAFQGAPHPLLGKRLDRIHDQKTAVGAEQRAAAQVHEVAGPAAARIVGALNGAKKIGVTWRCFKNNRRIVFGIMRQDNVHPVNAKRIALRPGRFLLLNLGSLRSLLFLSLAFLEGPKIVEDVVADLFQIFGHAGARIFFLQLLDDPVHQDRSRFLFQIAQLAGQLPRKCKCLAIDDSKFLAELFVLALDLLGYAGFQLSFMHHLGNVFDGHHLAFEHRENLRQGDRAHLHVS